MSCGSWVMTKICQNENFRHFPHPQKHENQAKMKVTTIIPGISPVYLQIFTMSGIFSDLKLVQTQLGYYLYHSSLKTKLMQNALLLFYFFFNVIST